MFLEFGVVNVILSCEWMMFLGFGGCEYVIF